MSHPRGSVKNCRGVSPERTRGFSTSMALAALVIIGILLAMLATLFATEAARTKATLQSAQQQQLLLAGQILAADALTHPINLPVTLHPTVPASTGDLTVSLISLTADTAAFLVTARTDNHAASQILTYQKTQSTWVLTSAALTSFNTPSNSAQK